MRQTITQHGSMNHLNLQAAAKFIFNYHQTDAVRNFSVAFRIKSDLCTRFAATAGSMKVKPRRDKERIKNEIR